MVVGVENSSGTPVLERGEVEEVREKKKPPDRGRASTK
jgi:hypothetical protein